jgi:plasmid stability protein
MRPEQRRRQRLSQEVWSMTLMIELSDDEQARLQAAAARDGVSAEECAREILVAHLPPERPGDRTLELFAQWEAEDATDDPEEIARRNGEWEEFKANINATRAEAGARILFP